MTNQQKKEDKEKTNDHFFFYIFQHIFFKFNSVKLRASNYISLTNIIIDISNSKDVISMHISYYKFS